jgi:predicted DCC family thiol-disulfide oxidoreductase YuxK
MRTSISNHNKPDFARLIAAFELRNTSSRVIIGDRALRPDLSQTGPVYLLYDDDCGSCTEFKSFTEHLDLMHRITPVPLHSDKAFELVSSRMTRAEMMQSMHVVYHKTSPGGRGDDKIFSGGDALTELIRFLPLGSLIYHLTKRFRSFRRMVLWAYVRMTRVRTRSKSCSVLR